MAKQGGMGDNYYAGPNNLSGDIGSLSNIHGGPNPQDVTGIDKSAIERIGLLRDGGLSASVWFNPTRAHPVLRALPYTDVVCSYFAGATLGGPAASCVAKQIGYDGTRGQDGSFTLAVEWQANGFGLEWGLQGTPGIRTDTTSTTGTGVDRGAPLASTAFGLTAYIHNFSFTGTSVVVKIQDSADNATFADLTGAVFTTITTGATAERITIGTTATVRRYLRVVTTGTFTNFQFAVNVAPYDTAQQ